MALPSLDRLSYIHCLLREFLPGKKLQAAPFFITSSSTLVLTALGIEIIRNLQGDVLALVIIRKNASGQIVHLRVMLTE